VRNEPEWEADEIDDAAVEHENVTNEPEREWSGDSDCRDAGVENENVTNEPERSRDLVEAEGFTAVENENVTNEPERSRDQVEAEGFTAVENENVTNEPERSRDQVEAEGFAAVENENVTNEPERERGWMGVGAPETVLGPLNGGGEVYLGSMDAGSVLCARDLPRPGEIAEGIRRYNGESLNGAPS
jgi:hypothetical protein